MILMSNGFEPDKKTTVAKKPMFGIIIAAVVVIVLLGVIFLPNLLKTPAPDESEPSAPSESVSNADELKAQMGELLTDDIGFQFLGSEDGQITDAQMAAYAVVKMDNYNWDTGNTREEYDAVTQKHFNRKLTDYTENGMTEAHPDSVDRIRAVGWGYEVNYHAVTRSLTKEGENRYVGQFYCLHIPYSIDEGWNYTDEEAGSMFAGDNWAPFVQYGRKPVLLEVTFTVGHEAGGAAYPIYERVKILQTDLTAPLSSQ